MSVSRYAYPRRMIRCILSVLMLIIVTAAAHAGQTWVWDGTTHTPSTPGVDNGILGPGFYPTIDPVSPGMPGGADDPVSPSRNTVIWDDTQSNGVEILYGNIYGGAGLSDGTGQAVDSTGNTVRIVTPGGNHLTVMGANFGSYGPDSGSVFGGFSTHGNASRNEVRLSTANSSVMIYADGWVIGGMAEGRDNSTGDAMGNNVTIEGDVVVSNGIMGGFSQNGLAEGNSITITGDPTNVNAVYGGSSQDGGANANTVRIDAGGAWYVYGGISYGDGTVNRNTVTLSGGTYASYVFGGASSHGEASGNQVSIKDSAKTENSVFGGYLNDWASTGSVTGNTVTIDTADPDGIGHAMAGGAVVGGLTFGSGAVTGNTVTLTNGTVHGQDDLTAFYGNAIRTIAGIAVGVAGGMSLGDGLVSRNSVTLSSNSVENAVYGGFSGSGSLAENTVTVNGDAAVTGTIYGGYNAARGNQDANSAAANAGTITANRVSVATTGNLDGGIIGGMAALDTATGTTASSGAVTGNAVTITGAGTVGGIALGGYTVSVAGGVSEGTGTVSRNTVTVGGGDFANDVIGGLSTTSGLASSNRVSLTGGTVAGMVLGGANSGTGNADKNIVTVSGTAAVSGIIAGGRAASGNAADNAVTVTGGNFSANTASVYGGFSDTGEAHGNAVTGTGVAMAGTSVFGGQGGAAAGINTVTLTSTDVDHVTGGNATTAGSTASGNTVTLTGGSVTGDVYGGHANAGSSINNTVSVDGVQLGAGLYGGNNADFTGNTLNTRAQGQYYTVGTIANFAKYNFILSATDVGETVYTVTTPVALDGVAIHSVLNSGGAPLNEGDRIGIFSQTDGGSADYGDTTLPNGALFDHDVHYWMDTADNNHLYLVIDSTRASRETRLLGQAQLAGLSMLGLASDLQRGVGAMITAAEAYRVAFQTADGPRYLDCDRPLVFASVTGGSSTYDTGGNSEVSLNHASFIGGVGYRPGPLLVAGFVEAGWGQFDAKMDGKLFNDNDQIDYYGGGALARYERGGFYAEASAHIGQMTTAFTSAVRHAMVDYNSSVLYFGGDAALGYRLTLPCSGVDLSLRYSYNLMRGDTVKVGANDVHLDDLASHRFRAGARWTAARTEVLTPYLGAAVTYEADGTSSGSVYNHQLAQAQYDGVTVMGEAGLHVGNPQSRYSADVGVEGYLGKRRGVAAKAVFGVTF